jgi:hypothetical protein
MMRYGFVLDFSDLGVRDLEFRSLEFGNSEAANSDLGRTIFLPHSAN